MNDHGFIIPITARLDRALSYFKPEAVPEIIRHALNATTGLRVRIAYELKLSGVQDDELMMEVVRVVNQAFRESMPEMMEVASYSRVMEVTYTPKHIAVTLRPDDEREKRTRKWRIRQSSNS